MRAAAVTRSATTSNVGPSASARSWFTVASVTRDRRFNSSLTSKPSSPTTRSPPPSTPTDTLIKSASDSATDATSAEFLQYIAPACGQTILVGVEVEPNGEFNGKPQYKYKLTYPKGSQKPTVQDNPPSEGVPF